MKCICRGNVSDGWPEIVARISRNSMTIQILQEHDTWKLMTFTLRCATPSLRTFERDSTHSLCKWLEREAFTNLPGYTWAGKTLYRKQPRRGKKEAEPETNNKIRSVVTLIQVSLHNEANSAKSNNMVEWLGRRTWNLAVHSLSLALTISWICFRQSLVQLLSCTCT